ncbi:MAG: hypothetical protein K2X69_07115 [Silvanigrellaceae bacterium]|nr:hypothetical protein [Silvanigrellaceae bacterium]
MENNDLIIATFQGNIKEKNLNYNQNKIKESLLFCDNNHVDILCMPECFLQGIFENFNDAYQNSINLNEKYFKDFCESIKNFKTSLIIGIIEEENNKIYSTAVVIENGLCIGKYRKSYSHPPFDYFSCGFSFPIFEKKGIKYGIIISSDASFIEPARILALQHAQILFCLCYNKNKNFQTISDHLEKRTNYITRAYENKVWLITSDIVWDFDGKYICSGYSSIFDGQGNLILKGNKFKEEILIHKIPFTSLRIYSNEVFFSGKSSLIKLLSSAYKNYFNDYIKQINLIFIQLNSSDNFNKSEIKLHLNKSLHFQDEDRLNKLIDKYTKNKESPLKMFAVYSEFNSHISSSEKELIGILAAHILDDKILIKHLSIKEELRGRKIGSYFLNYIYNKFNKKLEVETDEENVNFYLKNKFEIYPIETEVYNIIRFKCIKKIK